MNYQAFIFCGTGSNLTPFSNTRGDRGIPKALLPIANRPMIEYVLDWCDQAQFKEINIVASQDEVELIREGLFNFSKLRDQCFELLTNNMNNFHTHYLKKPSNISIIGTRHETTGEVLQKDLLDKITGDFVLLSCDFITNIPPQIILDQYLNRDHNSLALSVYYNNEFENIDKKQLKKSFTVYTENDDTVNQPVLLDVYSSDDVEKTKYLKIRSQMLWRYPNSIISMKLFNSFMYFCSYELAQLLSEDDEPGALDGEADVSEDEHATKNLLQIKSSCFKRKNKIIKDPINCRKSLAKMFRDLARRSWQHSKKRETIGIFTLPDIGTFIRANNLSAYMEANRYILKIKSNASNQTASTTASSSGIGADSVIGANCIILEKTNVKRSVLGKNCKVGNRCRIVGSILLDGVEIDDEVTLENVIIGSFGKVGRRSKLTNCYIEGSYVVPAKTVLKGETLTNIYLDEEQEYGDAALSSDSEGNSTEYSDKGYDEEEFEDDGLFDR